MSKIMAGLSMLNMPQEILSQIFYYLPVADRKNIRLTCHSFYEACNTFHIQNNEEINFYGNINTSAAILSLCNSERRFWNIRLNEVDLNSSILPFFAKHGARIYSLILCDCSLADGILRDIITLCCSNLCNCALIFNYSTDCYVWQGPYKTEHIHNAFIDLAGLCNIGTVCTQVTDFTFILYPHLYNELSLLLAKEVFIHIFNIFPNIKELDFRVGLNNKFDQANTNTLDRVSSIVFKSSFIYNRIMKMNNQLEKLCLHYRYKDACTLSTIDAWNKIANIEMQKLKQLSLNLILPEYSVFCTIKLSTFEKLSSLKCEVDINDGEISDYILIILNSAPNLHYLSLRFDETVRTDINRECFEALIKSKLMILEMNSEHEYSFDTWKMDQPSLSCADFHDSELNRSLNPNRSLKQLKVTVSDNNSLSLFSTYFQNLEHLELLVENDDILNKLTNIKELKSLCLFISDTYSSSSPGTDTSSCHQFDNLTHLRVIIRAGKSRQAMVFSDFRLPKLKSLSIERDIDMYAPEEDEFEIFWNAMKTFIQLEYLSIALKYPIEFHRWLELFQVLPKLKYFHILAGVRKLDQTTEELECELSKLLGFKDSECRQVFDLYPSLRTIIIAFDPCTHDTRELGFSQDIFLRYYKDIIENKVICMWLPPNKEGEGMPYYYFDYAPTYTDERRTRLFYMNY